MAALARSARRIAGTGWEAYCDPDDDTQRRAGRWIVMDGRLLFNALVLPLQPLADAVKREMNRAQGDGRR